MRTVNNVFMNMIVHIFFVLILCIFEYQPKIVCKNNGALLALQEPREKIKLEPLTEEEREIELLMHYVTRSNCTEVEQLLQDGISANINVKGDPLLAAAIKFRAKMPVINLLLSYGADIEAQDKEGNSVLLVAILKNNSMCAMRLVELGAQVNVRDSYDRSPLFYAVKRKNIELARFLLDAGADINAVTLIGETILQAAIASGMLDMVKLLFEYGGDRENTHMFDDAGNKLLYSDFAMLSNKMGIAEFLKSNNA